MTMRYEQFRDIALKYVDIDEDKYTETDLIDLYADFKEYMAGTDEEFGSRFAEHMSMDSEVANFLKQEFLNSDKAVDGVSFKLIEPEEDLILDHTERVLAFGSLEGMRSKEDDSEEIEGYAFIPYEHYVGALGGMIYGSRAAEVITFVNKVLDEYELQGVPASFDGWHDTRNGMINNLSIMYSVAFRMRDGAIRWKL